MSCSCGCRAGRSTCGGRLTRMGWDRHPRATPTESASCDPILPQALEHTGRHPSLPDHRQAAELSSRLPYPDPVGPALHRPVCEQSRRSVSSTDPPPRAPDARFQIDRAPPVLRVGPRRRPESLPRRPAPPTSRSSPHAPHPSVRRVERGDVCFVSSRPSSDLGRRPGPRPAS